MSDYPTPDQQLEGDDPRVDRIVADIRGAFSTTGGEHPVFQPLVGVEAVVRFVLLRSDAFESDLLAAAKLALEEMCHTVAPRNSFTDAVDVLDAAIARRRPTAPRR